MNPFRSRRAAPSPTARRRSRGQVIVIFAGAMLAFMGLMAIVIDVSWYWANTLRVQRAADAAALAGVVWLPSKFDVPIAGPNAKTTALDEARKNGYVPGGSTTITMTQDASNDRRLIVTIDASVPTFFARVLGIQSLPVSRTSKAEFILPVAMGSPENYYGNFGTIRDATYTRPVTSDTGFDPATGSPSSVWPTPANADATPNTSYAVSPVTNGSQQQWTTFNFTNNTPQIPVGATINGIDLQIGAFLSGTGAVSTNCTIGVELSWNNGTNWSSIQSTPTGAGSLTTTKTVFPIGSQANTTAWGAHPWVQPDFANTGSQSFRVRLTWNRGSCAATQRVSIDTLVVRVTYTQTVTTTGDQVQNGPGTPCVNGLTDCKQPDGTPLNAHGFWATMNTEGAANVNGDAYQPYYNSNGANGSVTTVAPTCPAAVKACYDGFNYYNYAIEMPAGATNGFVWIFDPGFCATAPGSGTGDRWFETSTQNGNIPNYTPISSWYELYDTKGTPYNLLDDAPSITDSGNRFVNLAGYDTSMNGGNTSLPWAGTTDCRQKNTQYGNGNDYHDQWYLLNPGHPLSGPSTAGSTTVYRLHTTSSNPITPGDNTQRGADGEQSFSIYVQATGGATPPNVYGMGAMQMFTPLELPATTTFSEFYLAQVPKAHAGKTLEISLWDPGDTGTLHAALQIEAPTPSGWSATGMTWSAVKGTSNSQAQNCSSTTQSGNSITTNVGGNHPNGTTGVYNGCWLTIDIAIPPAYQADQNGWWKIKYNMSDTGVSNDVTTWTAKIRGNPVHLVLP